MSGDDSSQQLSPPSTTPNYDPSPFSSDDNSQIKLYDNSVFKEIITTPQTDIPIDRLRHPSQNQSNFVLLQLTELLKLIIT